MKTNVYSRHKTRVQCDCVIETTNSTAQIYINWKSVLCKKQARALSVFVDIYMSGRLLCCPACVLCMSLWCNITSSNSSSYKYIITIME